MSELSNRIIPELANLSDIGTISLLNTSRIFIDSPIWQIRAAVVKSVALSLSKHWGILDQYDINILLYKLYDPEIEVRKTTSESLIPLMNLLSTELLSKIAINLKSNAESFGKSDINIITLHGAILGLISLIKSHAIEIANWVPEILDYILKFEDNYGVVSDSVKICVFEFWNRHKPTWEYEKNKFTKEQLDNLVNCFIQI